MMLWCPSSKRTWFFAFFGLTLCLQLSLHGMELKEEEIQDTSINHLLRQSQFSQSPLEESSLSTKELPTSSDSFSLLPTEMIVNIVEYTPDSLPALLITNKYFFRIAADIAKPYKHWFYTIVVQQKLLDTFYSSSGDKGSISIIQTSALQNRQDFKEGFARIVLGINTKSYSQNTLGRTYKILRHTLEQVSKKQISLPSGFVFSDQNSDAEKIHPEPFTFRYYDCCKYFYNLTIYPDMRIYMIASHVVNIKTYLSTLDSSSSSDDYKKNLYEEYVIGKTQSHFPKGLISFSKRSDYEVSCFFHPILAKLEGKLQQLYKMVAIKGGYIKEFYTALSSTNWNLMNSIQQIPVNLQSDLLEQNINITINEIEEGLKSFIKLWDINGSTQQLQKLLMLG